MELPAIIAKLLIFTSFLYIFVFLFFYIDFYFSIVEIRLHVQLHFLAVLIVQVNKNNFIENKFYVSFQKYYLRELVLKKSQIHIIDVVLLHFAFLSTEMMKSITIIYYQISTKIVSIAYLRKKDISGLPTCMSE